MSRCTGPMCSPSASHGAGDLPGVERVVDPPVRGQAAPQLRRHTVLGLAGDQGQLGARQPRRGLDEPRRRVEQIRRDEGGDHHAWEIPRCVRSQSARCARSQIDRPRLAFQA